MATVSCPHCSKLYKTKKSLSDHIGQRHSQTVKLKTTGNLVLEVRRGKRGTFKCPEHGTEGTRSKFVEKHKDCFLSLTNQSTTLQHIEQADGSQEDSAISLVGRPRPPKDCNDGATILQCYGLGYDEQLRAIYCISCQGHVKGDIRRHLKRCHDITIWASHERKLTELYTREIFIPEKGKVYPALHYLDTPEGWQCMECKWCCLKESATRGHLAKSPSCSGFSKCSVQSVDLAKKVYFRVAIQRPSTEPFTEFMLGGSAILESVKVEMEACRQRERPLEDFRIRDPFYLMLQWMDEREVTSLIAFEHANYSELPGNLEPSLQVIETHIRCLIDSVSNYPLYHRERLKSGERPFGPLHTEASRAEYCKTAKEFVSFTVNWCHKPIPTYNCGDLSSLGRYSQAFAVDPSYSNMIDLVHEATTQIMHFPDSGQSSNATDVEGLLILYLRLKTLKSDGSLSAAEDVSRRCAQMEYLMKATFLEWHRLQGRMGSLHENLPQVTGDSLNCSAALYVLHSQASRHNSFRDLAPNIIELNHGMELSVDGVIVPWHFCRILTNELKTHVAPLQNSLLLDLPYKINSNDVRECIGNLKVGFSMSLNGCDHELLLISHIIDHSNLAKKFLLTVATGAHSWNVQALRTYLDDFDKMVQFLLCIIHIESGMPARGTELYTYSIRNGRSMPRTLKFDGESVYFHTLYSKTNAVTGVRREISRFLSPKTSILVLNDVLLIRPFAAFAASKVYGDEAFHLYRKFLFVRNGERMSAEDICDTFSYFSNKYSGGKPLNFQRYRHYVKHIAREYFTCDD